jgi:prolyl-tRNA editing enzyme YbaK/EbsC (Cys-tRNA(Pro) deacylase)
MPDEIDVGALVDDPRLRPLVPRTEDGGMLTLHDLRAGELVRHRFGFMEPGSSSEPVDFDDVDVVLVPGTVFDRSGARIGKGAGMYDRLLSALPAGVVTVGVTVEALVVDELPTEPHDRRVDWLATESGVRLTDRPLSTSAESVVGAAVTRGVAPAMVRFPEGTKTSSDAARAVGAELGSIAKSLVFLVDDEPTLVICSGDHRVSETKLAAHFDAADARTAPLDVVRAATGFVAGGTPAMGHVRDLRVVADTSLCRYRWVWSAGGTPDTVYPVALERLIAASGARWADVSERG